MRESDVEKKFVKRVKDDGGVAYKFVSPGHIGVPDRLALYPIKDEHINIVGKYVVFVELKAPGKKPRPSQVREHKRLSAMGFKVEVIDK